MEKIKFGTDGWRGIIADTFTISNVAKVSNAVAIWLLNKYRQAKVVVGYDTRFGGELFAHTVAKVIASKGIKVFLSRDFVSSPMVSYGITWYEASVGIIITASHNSYEYSGYKIKGEYGGPLLEENIKNIEDLIPDEPAIDINLIKWDNLVNQGLIELIDLESIYIEKLKSSFDLEKIRSSACRFVFDAMYGSGQRVIRKVLPNVKNLNCKPDPMFNHMSPEPLEVNLQEMINLIRTDKRGFDCGLAVDGDADRMALVDKKGRYIDYHHILLLLIHCLVKYRKQTGKIIAGFSSTMKTDIICNYYGLELQKVKSDFKEICRIILKEDVLIGGEESGGIAIRNFIPERDGIWNGLYIWQFMVELGKSLEELLDEVYAITGPFACEKKEILLNKDQQYRIMEDCKKGMFKSFGNFKVIRTEQLDGFRFFFSQNEWALIRPSGTEPKLMLFAESDIRENALTLIQNVHETILVT